jgi:DNA-binding transcriptional MerR regulator
LIRIGQVAQGAGVSVRKVRYYEEQGLLEAARTPSGHRRYPPAAVERLQLVRQMYAAGLTSRTIAPLLSYLESDHTDLDQYTLARVERDRITTRIDDLHAVLYRLDQVITPSQAHA